MKTRKLQSGGASAIAFERAHAGSSAQKQEVPAAFDVMRQVLDSSRVQIERAKRLMWEAEELLRIRSEFRSASPSGA